MKLFYFFMFSVALLLALLSTFFAFQKHFDKKMFFKISLSVIILFLCFSALILYVLGSLFIF